MFCNTASTAYTVGLSCHTYNYMRFFFFFFFQIGRVVGQAHVHKISYLEVGQWEAYRKSIMVKRCSAWIDLQVKTNIEVKCSLRAQLVQKYTRCRDTVSLSYLLLLSLLPVFSKCQWSKCPITLLFYTSILTLAHRLCFHVMQYLKYHLQNDSRHTHVCCAQAQHVVNLMWQHVALRQWWSTVWR